MGGREDGQTSEASVRCAGSSLPADTRTADENRHKLCLIRPSLLSLLQLQGFLILFASHSSSQPMLHSLYSGWWNVLLIQGTEAKRHKSLGGRRCMSGIAPAQLGKHLRYDIFVGRDVQAHTWSRALCVRAAEIPAAAPVDRRMETFAGKLKDQRTCDIFWGLEWS